MKRNQLMKNRNIIYAMILFWLVCFGLPQRAQAVVLAPGDGYPGGNAAEGHVALLSLTVSSYNTAIGLLSLSSNTGGNFNTAIGAGAVLSDTIVALLVIPWLVRGLASAKAIWRALTVGQRSDRKKERCALADS
jgi:hypothetical protein